MALTKKEFQDISINITNLISKFTNLYPNNWGEIVQHKISVIIIIVGILFLGLPAFLISDASLLVGWFGGPALIIIGFKKAINNDLDEPDIQSEKNIINQKLENLDIKSKDYPDVQQYCKDMVSLVSKTANEKNNILEKAENIFKYSTLGAILIVVLGFIFSDFSLTVYLQEFLSTGIKENEPIEINQYQGNGILSFSICDKIPNKSVTNTTYEYIYINSVNISQSNNCEQYLLKFVDENGITYPEFPIFTINKDTINNNCCTGLWSEITNPENFDNHFIMLQLLKRIKNNKILYKIDCYEGQITKL
ncbi:MAG: hypothetical protein MJ211_01335 [Bacteroidales bacterium]|nr:hypothetical protein [Bacteroidales bacterium]